ncbi:hypothetical protein ECDEC5C_4602 [Escherichia coli DEC5C]|nr:hypothetical protein ECDEC5C_4602 [Escherichia coli DEC5C]
MLNLNDNDEKVKIENDIKKIDKKIEEIDNAIRDLFSETERFKIKYQQENTLNDVVQKYQDLAKRKSKYGESY